MVVSNARCGVSLPSLPSCVSRNLTAPSHRSDGSFGSSSSPRVPWQFSTPQCLLSRGYDFLSHNMLDVSVDVIVMMLQVAWLPEKTDCPWRSPFEQIFSSQVPHTLRLAHVVYHVVPLHPPLLPPTSPRSYIVNYDQCASPTGVHYGLFLQNIWWARQQSHRRPARRRGSRFVRVG